MELEERVDKAKEWIDAEVQEEYKRISRNKFYVDNKDFLEKIKIKPLIALRKLIDDMYNQIQGG